MLPKLRLFQSTKTDAIARKIRRQRLASSMSDQNLADSLCISIEQLQRYENGTDPITVRNLLKIADTLQIHITYFFEGLSEVDKNVHFIEPEATPEQLRILRAIKKIKSPRLLKDIEETIAVYAETDLTNLKLK